MSLDYLSQSKSDVKEGRKAVVRLNALRKVQGRRRLSVSLRLLKSRHIQGVYQNSIRMEQAGAWRSAKPRSVTKSSYIPSPFTP
jgi:hypothetical protein